MKYDTKVPAAKVSKPCFSKQFFNTAIEHTQATPPLNDEQAFNNCFEPGQLSRIWILAYIIYRPALFVILFFWYNVTMVDQGF
jgi:hypothetical protein